MRLYDVLVLLFLLRKFISEVTEIALGHINYYSAVRYIYRHKYWDKNSTPFKWHSQAKTIAALNCACKHSTYVEYAKQCRYSITLGICINGKTTLTSILSNHQI